MADRMIDLADFCRNCLRFMDEAERDRVSIVITKDGEAYLRVDPVGSGGTAEE